MPETVSERPATSTPPASQSGGFDLLSVAPVRALVRWAGFPYVFQALTLIVAVALMIMGWGQLTPEGINAKLFARSNLVTLLIWGLWWPAMVWLTVLFGRAWCTVCPLELVSNLSERLARRLGIPQLPLASWITSGAIIVALYGLLQFLVAGAQLHRVPAYTSIFILALLAMAVATGLLFKDRAFCRGFCPVAQLLAVYGRGGMLAVRAGSEDTCAACAGKECIQACNRYRADARSCPSLLNPPKLNSSRDCLICGQCIKSCQPDNMRLLLRWPFHSRDAREPLASWPTTIFVMLVSGFVTWELCTEWKAAEAVFLAPPNWLNERIGVAAIAGYVRGLWALAFVPLLIWTVMAGAARLLGDGTRLTESWRRMALPVAVVVAGGQMAKGLAKFVSWVGFVPYALGEPLGTNTAATITAKTLPQPNAMLPPVAVSVIGMALLVTALFFAIREARLAHPAAGHARLVPKLALAAGFLFIVFGWGFSFWLP